MNVSTHKTRIVCGAIALNLLATASWGRAETGPLTGAQPAPAMPAPTTSPAPTPDSPMPASQPTVAESASPAGGGSPPEPTVDATPAQPLNVVYSRLGLDNSTTKEAMNSLRVVRQQATRNQIGQQVAINAALIFLTGGLALNVQGFGKDDLTGIEPEGAVDKDRLKNPAIQHLPAEIQKRAAQWLLENHKTREMKFTRPLVVNSAAWRLVYNSLDEADPTYKLKFDVAIYKDRDRPSFITGNKKPGKPCSYVSEARPLSDWKANDYQAVADAVPQVVRQCADEFIPQLPRLLELQ